jgi:hypothetical protein
MIPVRFAMSDVVADRFGLHHKPEAFNSSKTAFRQSKRSMPSKRCANPFIVLFLVHAQRHRQMMPFSRLQKSLGSWAGRDFTAPVPKLRSTYASTMIGMDSGSGGNPNGFPVTGQIPRIFGMNQSRPHLRTSVSRRVVATVIPPWPSAKRVGNVI